jgi:mannose-6-phosphate isomerase-like protein (cupin superfamily)
MSTRRTFIKSAGVIGALAAGGFKVASASSPESAKKHRTADGERELHCVVTGQSKSGKSTVVSHAPLKPVTVALMPGYEFYRFWGSDTVPTLPSDGTPPPQPQYFPPKNGFRFGMFTLPPATSTSAEPSPSSALVQEVEQKLPGVLQALEPDHPGMHTTDTVDFDVVVFGEVVLELDDGAEVLLKAGDCVIQNGTRHAWHNRSGEKCMIAFSLVGADRKTFPT